MIQSKAWNWDQIEGDYWKTVAPEFLPVALEWKAKGFRRALDLGCGIGRHSIYHTDMEGLRRVVAEIRRVLKPGGELFVTLNSKNSDAWNLFASRRIDDHTLLKTEGPEIDVPHTYLDYHDVLDLLKDFSLIKIQETFDFWENRKYAHFLVTCRGGGFATHPDN